MEIFKQLFKENTFLPKEQYSRMEKAYVNYETLKMVLLPDTPVEEMDDITARDLMDVINAKIEEGKQV